MKDQKDNNIEKTNNELEGITKDLIDYLSSGEPIQFDDLDEETQEKLEQINLLDWL